MMLPDEENITSMARWVDQPLPLSYPTMHAVSGGWRALLLKTVLITPSQFLHKF